MDNIIKYWYISVTVYTAFRGTSMREILTVRVPDGEKKKIAAVVKQEYPQLKNYSDVVRCALNEFLNGRKATQ